MENYYSEHEGTVIDNMITNASLHMQDDSIHVTQAQKTAWNNKVSALAMKLALDALKEELTATDAILSTRVSTLASNLLQKLDVSDIDVIQNVIDYYKNSPTQNSLSLIAYTTGLYIGDAPALTDRFPFFSGIEIPVNTRSGMQIMIDCIDQDFLDTKAVAISHNLIKNSTPVTYEFGKWIPLPDGNSYSYSFRLAVIGLKEGLEGGRIIVHVRK